MAQIIKGLSSVSKSRKAFAKRDVSIKPFAQTEISHESIERLAYAFWEESGRQHGRSLENWLRAEIHLRREGGN
jgi:hypothetical protein